MKIPHPHFKLTCVQRLYGVFVHHRKIVIISLCNALLITIFSYFLNNQFLFTGESLAIHAFTGYVKAFLGLEKEEDEDVVYINVGYDKKLIDIYDENYPKGDDNRIKFGNIDITDRSKLLKLLKKLEKCNYKYICLDVLFEKGYEDDENDSLLFSQIKRMKNIVLPYSEIHKLADTSLVKKSAYASHLTTIVSTNFVRYPLTKSDTLSISAYPYYEITGNRIKSHWLFYTCAGRLCYNSVFLDFPMDIYNKTEDFQRRDSKGNQNYYNLGTEVLENEDENWFRMFVNEKYIFIGDFVNPDDMHDTYVGKRPGALINYCAFKALMEGKHYYSWPLAFFLGIVYFLISLSLLSKKGIFENFSLVMDNKIKLLPYITALLKYTLLLTFIVFLLHILGKLSLIISCVIALLIGILCFLLSRFIFPNSNSKLLHFIISSVKYSLLLTFLEIVLHLFADVSLSILMPSLYFAIFETFIKYKNYKS